MAALMDDGKRLVPMGTGRLMMRRVIGLLLAAAGTLLVSTAGAQMTQAGVDATAKAAHQAVIPYTPGKHIYPTIDAAQSDVAAALKEARKEHKRVILDFGADWCGDCQVLDIYFHQSPNEEILDKNFIEVKVNIGRMDANLDVAHKYGVPVHAVPALAVLRPDGSVVVSQDKEFSDMRYMQSSSLTTFLNKWKK
jgi:thiol:disulfide interchange protein